jgi:hypothetical protein
MAAALAARDPAVDTTGRTTRALLAALTEAWERGWQPADVVHAVRRRTAARAARLTVALLAEDARLTDAAGRAPEPWIHQLRELGALDPGDREVVAAWHRTEGRPAAETWRAVLHVATVLCTLPRIDHLVPPPSLWATSSREQLAPTAGDARLLHRIRSLLAKAESTEFPEEAEALTAKAQELMARHAVDAALLDSGATTPAPAFVGTRRVHVDDPYVRAKMQLLGAVADANGVRLVWYQSLAIANLVGVPTDLDAVELLFTSLLLQAGPALAAAERSAASPRSASRPFRRAFLLGYAGRIGERLRSTRERATSTAAAEHGVDLLPVLRSRQEAVDDAFTELFPRLRSSRSRASMDPAGWHAGRTAADTADVGSRRSRLR